MRMADICLPETSRPTRVMKKSRPVRRSWRGNGRMGPTGLLLVTRGGSGEILSAVQQAKRQTLASGSRVRVIGTNATDVVASVVANGPDSTGVFRFHLDGSGGEKLADIGDADAWW